MRRRDLLRFLALTTGGVCLPRFVSAEATGRSSATGTEPSGMVPPEPAPWRGALVLLELKGGNDGLNTVVPYSDPEYARLRPKLAIGRDQVLALDERLGLNPALSPLLPIWRDAELALVLGVGYAQPNRSHFRSIAIWESGSDSAEVLDQGWLTRWMPRRADGATPLPDVVVLGGEDGPAQGGALRVISLERPETFVHEAARLRALETLTETRGALGAMLAERQAIRETGLAFKVYLDGLANLSTTFPATSLGRQLEQVARMLVAGMRIPVFKVRIGSFDTHTQQRGRHDRLLGELAQALASFRNSLHAAGLWNSVIVMTYSEFGRRAAENASQGTDHGAAAPHFVLGGKVKGGLYGQQPTLTALERGDLCYTVDYRQLYTTIAQRWWGASDIAWQQRFSALEFL